MYSADNAEVLGVLWSLESDGKEEREIATES